MNSLYRIWRRFARPDGGGALLKDAQWAMLEPLVEQCRPKGKTPPQDLHRTLEAILWRHRNGAKWRAVDDHNVEPRLELGHQLGHRTRSQQLRAVMAPGTAREQRQILVGRGPKHLLQ